MIDTFTKTTDKIPVFKRLSIRNRLIITFFAGLILIVGLVYYLTRPTLSGLISGNNMCIVQAVYQDQELVFNTNGLSFYLRNCDYHISFDENGYVEFPGLGTDRIQARWREKNGKLIVSDADTLQSVFEGTYTWEFDGHLVRLRSESTIFILYKWESHL